MHRKDFLAGIIPLAAAVRNVRPFGSSPPYLKAGDIIGITSPAGYISSEEIMPAVRQLQSWGYHVKIGNAIGKREFTRGGTDEERLMDFQSMLDDRKVSAILCARGGYGCLRIIDKINFDVFCMFPKWIIGFSDITVLHSHIQSNFGIPTIHSKMCNSFPASPLDADEDQRISIESISAALRGDQYNYVSGENRSNIFGSTTGILAGGNLKVLENLSGTVSALETKNKILFIEDTGEYLYNIDRMFWNLERSGRLKNLRGLIVGNIKTKSDDPGEEFGKTVEEIVLEKTRKYKYPVCFDFPVGHQRRNLALRCGMPHKLTVRATAVLQSV